MGSLTSIKLFKAIINMSYIKHFNYQPVQPLLYRSDHVKMKFLMPLDVTFEFFIAFSAFVASCLASSVEGGSSYIVHMNQVHCLKYISGKA
jgi:hypothetical protein